jgi:ankyrin repeat protein
MVYSVFSAPDNFGNLSSAYLNSHRPTDIELLNNKLKEILVKKKIPLEEDFEIIRNLIRAGADPNTIGDCRVGILFDGYTAMYLACTHGNSETVKFLIENGADLDYIHLNYGDTYLHDAITREYHDIAKLLIEAGANLNIENRYGLTPLQLAIKYNNTEIINHLINHGADVNRPDKKGETLLHWSIWNGEYDIAELLIKSGRVNLNFKNTVASDTPLIFAIYKDQLEIVKLLIENGADFTSSNKDGNTPLHSAITLNRSREIIDFLIQKNMEIAPENASDGIPLHWAVNAGDLKVVKLLYEREEPLNIKDGNGNTPLHNAIKKKFTNIALFLIQNGAELSVEDRLDPLLEKIKNKAILLALMARKGNIGALRSLILQGVDFKKENLNLLHTAISNRDQALAEFLLENGADLKDVNSAGQTPFIWAVKKGSTFFIKLLIDKQIPLNDLYVKDLLGRTLLQQAILENQTEMAELLIELGSLDFLNECDIQGYTALHFAATLGNIAIAKLLTSKGVCMNTRTNYDGWTPLHLAIRAGNNELVRILLTARACVDMGNNLFNRPLLEAVERGDIEIVETLLNANPQPDLNVENVNRITPLLAAIKSNRSDIVELLIKHNVNINFTPHHRITPLLWAFESDTTEIASLLIKNGALLVLELSPENTAALHSILVKLAAYRNPLTRKNLVTWIHYNLTETQQEYSLKNVRDAIEKEEEKILISMLKANAYGGLAELLKAKQRLEKSLKGKKHPDLLAKQKEIAPIKDRADQALTLLRAGRTQEAKALLEINLEGKLKYQSVLFSYLIGTIDESHSKEDATAIINTIADHIDLKDNIKHQIVISTAYTLLTAPHIRCIDKIAILKRLTDDFNRTLRSFEGEKISAKDKKIKTDAAVKDLIKSLSRIQTLVKLEETTTLTELLSSDIDSITYLKDAMSRLLQSKFDLSDVENIADKYESTFQQQFRDPEAIFTYLGSLNKHPEENIRELYKSYLSLWVKDILEGICMAERYDTSDESPHLKSILEGPNGIEVIELWKRGETLSAQELAPDEAFGSLYEVCDGDDPCDLLLSGEECVGSCQKLTDGDPQKNAGLLGTLLDGKCRIVTVKNKKDLKGKIITRCLIRILWDSVEKRAVLFQEPTYSSLGDSPLYHYHDLLLNEMCKKRALKMGIPLLKTSRVEGEPGLIPYPNPVGSLGGASPVEYIDALRGVTLNFYEIPLINRFETEPKTYYLRQVSQ